MPRASTPDTTTTATAHNEKDDKARDGDAPAGPRGPHGRLTSYDPEYQAGGPLPHRLTAEEAAMVGLRRRVEHFTWANFTLPMSTGALALLLSQQSHTFDGLRTIGKVVFIFDLVVFTLMTSLMATRFALFPRKLRSSLSNPTESLFAPAFLLCLPTIIACMAVYGVPSAGPWLVVAVRVLFWTYVPVAFLAAVAQYTYIFTGCQLTIQSMTPAWLLPIYPAMLSGTIASYIAPDQPPAQRLPILVAGATFQGLGFWMAISLYAIYMLRMMEYGPPGPNLRPGMFVAVGPPSYTGLALIGISRALPTGYGYFATHPTAAENLQQLALAFAIFVWAVAFFMFALGVAACLLGARRMSFHLSWWTSVFPNVGFTLAVIDIGRGLESAAVGWVGSGMTVCLVVVYLFVLGAHVRALALRQIMWPGMDEDKDD